MFGYCWHDWETLDSREKAKIEAEIEYEDNPDLPNYSKLYLFGSDGCVEDKVCLKCGERRNGIKEYQDRIRHRIKTAKSRQAQAKRWIGED